MRSEVRKRSQLIAVRVTPEEHARYAALAERNGLSLPHLMRLGVEAALLQEQMTTAERVTDDDFDMTEAEFDARAAAAEPVEVTGPPCGAPRYNGTPEQQRRCQKPAGHADHHLHIGSGTTEAWGLFW